MSPIYRLLVVDDEEKIRGLIRKYAEFEGHQVSEARNGMEAVELCRKNPQAYDLIVMDVMMPELDGFSAAAEIKKISPIPVLMLSARGEEYDKIHGFELGADDYVVKPFSPKELMLRVHAIMNRVRPAAAQPRQVESFGGLSVDFSARVVTVDGQRVELTKNELKMLQLLLEHKGQTVSRDAIMTALWESDSFVDENTLSVNVNRLRRNLEAAGLPDFIHTRKGAGYLVEG